MSPGTAFAGTPVSPLAHALRRGAGVLLALRRGEGHWQGELHAGAAFETDYVLLQLWLHPPQGKEWRPPTWPLVEKAVRGILDRQLPDGGFNVHPEGPADVSASVHAYFALKVAGLDPEDGRMVRLRARILDLGGVQAANGRVQINLSLFGLYPREHAPSVPPEMMLAGNLVYQMSSWARAVVIPLSIVQSSGLAGRAPEGMTLGELVKPGASFALRRDSRPFTWKNFFLALDRVLKFWERRGLRAVRRRAVAMAAQWMLERLRRPDGLTNASPAMIYTVMALDALGYARNSAEHIEARRQCERLLAGGGSFPQQFPPVWQTAIAAFALGESGLVSEETLRPSADWLLAREVRHRDDWSVKRPHAEPSGWFPGIDGTAAALLALLHARASHAGEQQAACRRAVEWLLAMQSEDGGWAAFEADNNWLPLAAAPFAGPDPMLDLSCPDITGRVIEALCGYGVGVRHAAIRRGVEFLKRTQEADGSWPGRWGNGYLYGTCHALRGLAAAGESDREVSMLRGAEWLRSIQNADGGWGESGSSCSEGCFIPAPSAPSRTAQAVLGLLAGGDTASESLRRGAGYLAEAQREDGTWDEPPATRTCFCGVDVHDGVCRNSYPVLALAAYQNTRGMRQGDNQ